MRTAAILLMLLAPRDSFRHDVNAERDCRLVATGPRLEREARAWSREMAATSLHHSILDPGKWDYAGEVIGAGPSWRSILVALWDSPEHRRILLDCVYRKIAVGIARVSGTTWLTARLYG